ncbi:hypothetical protein Bca4012_090018 [Brassica carinata]
MSKISGLTIVLVALIAVLVSPVRSQQPPLSQCTPSMMTTVGPCMSILTNSSTNGTSPSSDCCNSLRSLTTGGMGSNIAPAAAPGPAGTFGPAMSPGPATTPLVPEPTPEAQTPQSDTTKPFTPTVDGAGPRSDDGGSSSRPSVTPSSAHTLSPSLLFFGVSLLALKFY